MTTMTRLPHTPDLHHLLQSVSDKRIVHHSGCDAWTVGWSWADGGHMDDTTNGHVDTRLWHALLISFDVPSNPCGNLAKLTFDGSALLAEWDCPKGSAA